MKYLMFLVFSMTTLGAFAFWRVACDGKAVPEPKNEISQDRAEHPFACDTSALSPQQRMRHFLVLGPELRSSRKSARELEDGYEFEFPPDTKTYGLVTEWAIQ